MKNENNIHDENNHKILDTECVRRDDLSKSMLMGEEKGYSDVSLGLTEALLAEEVPKSKKSKNILAILFLCFLVLIIVLGVIFKQELMPIFGDFFKWMEQNEALGTLALYLIFILCMLLLIPASVPALGAAISYSYMFPFATGYLICVLVIFISNSSGSLCAFLTGRYFLKSYLIEKSKDNIKLRAIDNGFKSKGIRFIILLRLCPIIPFSILNYLIGTTSIPVRHFVLGCVGSIPHTMMLTYIGMNIKNLDAFVTGDYSLGTGYLVGMIIGGVFGVIVIVYIVKVSRREINKIMNESLITSRTTTAATL